MNGAEGLLAMIRQEREVIRAGRFERLPDLLQARERAMAAFIGAGPTAEQLEDIRREASAVGEVLRAARAGVARANRRITALAEGESGFTTYTPGGLTRHTGLGRDLARRA